MKKNHQTYPIKAIIGLGNPGPQYYYQRHNIGFRILDTLATRYKAPWQDKSIMQITTISINNTPIILIKPQTFMNKSGSVIPFLSKKGIKAEHILVAHDELEKPFGSLGIKSGGSARGHNGLRSIINECGKDFVRLRFGISRPDQREMVPSYVLSRFDQNEDAIMTLIEKAADMIEQCVASDT